MNQDYLDLVRQVLDRQVVDANHLPCGKVDDLEIDWNKTPKISALLIGQGAAGERLPELFKVLSQRIFGRRVTRIPWSEVSVITGEIKLRSRADELNLDERKGWIFNFISRLPGAWKK
jgi:sporulation protein YlmC with PRC-barrel domain